MRHFVSSTSSPTIIFRLLKRFRLIKPRALAAGVAASLVLFTTALATADVVTLRTGETLSGQVIAQGGNQVVLAHPVLGMLTLAADDVTHVAIEATVESDGAGETAKAPSPTSPPDAAPEVPPLGVTAPAAPAAPPAPSFFEDWTSRLELGFSGSEFHSEDMRLRAAFKTQRETDRLRTAFETMYRRESTDGEETANDFTAGLVNDWLNPNSPWFYFAEGRYTWDDFAGYDHRVTGAGGVGYFWVREEHFKFDTRVGLALTREFGSENDELRPEGYFGGDLAWTFDDGRQELALVGRVFPSLLDLGAFRTRSAAEWRVKMAGMDGVSFKLGVEHEYESDPSDGVDENDLTYFGSLVYEF